MSTYSVMHYAEEHGLEPWQLLLSIPESEDYGIGGKTIVDPEGNYHHDEYHDESTLAAAAAAIGKEH